MLGAVIGTLFNNILYSKMNDIFQLLETIPSNAVVIFFGAAILVFILNRSKKKKEDEKRNLIQREVEEGAAKAGIQIKAQADGQISDTGEVHGDTTYSGDTGGINWNLTSSVHVADSGEERGEVWKRKSVWTSSAVKLPTGKFILLMSMPRELKLGNIKRGGFINNLVNKAADIALDIYVSNYFGSQYKSLVNIGDDGVKVEHDQLKDFVILTNIVDQANRFFDEATAATISNWKNNNAGFSDENKADHFGLLFSPDGVMLSCQTNMKNASEVKSFSDFGAVLAIKMQQTNHQN